MKKIYLLALSAIFGLSAMAQVSVTFQVDMTGQTVSANGVHVAGDWQSEAGFPADWEPGTAMMTDVNMDNIYSLTVDLPAGQYEYKFINDNDWPGGENIPLINQKGGGNSNRVFAVSTYHATDGYAIPAVMFSGSAPADQVAVRLTVDMASQEVSENGVHVAGTLFAEEWSPGYGLMFSSTASKYAYVANVDQSTTYNYLFLNGNGEEDYEAAPEDCTTDGNRSVTVEAEDVSVESVCYEGCSACTAPGEVTLTVDMNNVTVVAGEVFAAGSFNGYSNQAMTDNSDGTYSLTLMLDPGTYQFKFKNGPDGWENVPTSCQGEGTSDREFTIAEADELSITRCFEQCVEACVANPDPSDITFRVNMANETVAAEGVWVMGGFTSPQWQAGAIEMTDADADGVYEATVSGVSGSADVAYKFANGDPTSVEENGDFIAGGCGVSNGLGGFNRTLVRTGEPQILDIVCYNACVDCEDVGIEENVLGNVSIFPNPSNGLSYIDVQNPNGYKLTMSIVDITGKMVVENVVISSSRTEINTKNLNSGLYFLNIVNSGTSSASATNRSVYKLMVK